MPLQYNYIYMGPDGHRVKKICLCFVYSVMDEVSNNYQWIITPTINHYNYNISNNNNNNNNSWTSKNGKKCRPRSASHFTRNITERRSHSILGFQIRNLHKFKKSRKKNEATHDNEMYNCVIMVMVRIIIIIIIIRGRKLPKGIINKSTYVNDGNRHNLR